MDTLYLLTFCILISMYIIYRVYNRGTRTPSSNIPFVPRKFSYIVDDLWPKKHLVLHLTELYHGHPEQPVVGFHMCLAKFLLIRDLTIARNILIESFEHFQDRGMYSNTQNDPLSAILGTLNYHEWKPLRATLSAAFTPYKIKGSFRIMKNMGDKMTTSLKEIIATDNSVEIRDFFSRFATDVVGEVGISIDCNTLTDSGTILRDMMKKSLGLQFNYTRIAIAHPKFARFLRIRKHSPEINEFFIDVVKQAIKHRMGNPNGCRKDYLQILIDADLTVNQIAALLHDLLSAGYSDSTSTLTYCLYELSLPQNKHIQVAAREEVRYFLEQNSGQLTLEVLHRMAYCKKIIEETLRKHPPGGYLMRIATKEYKVPNSDITIPKGMRVLIPVFTIHHDEKYHPDPEVFNPERQLTCNTDTYMPFGRGRRQCIGFAFATLLVYTGLVSLLRDFEFSTCDRSPIPMEYSSTKNTLVPKSGVWLKVTPMK